MATYYFHHCDGIDVLIDPDGIQLSGIGPVSQRALVEARSIMSHEVREGRLDLDQRIDVADEAGAIVHSLQFTDAVAILRAKAA